MIAKDWIEVEIKEVVIQMPHLRIRYENHILSNTHFIEIVPNSIFYLNEPYMAWEEDITIRFIKKFSGQSICFVSDDAIVGIEKVDFEIKGRLFDFYYSENIQSYHVVSDVQFASGNFQMFETPPVATETIQAVISDFSGLSLKYTVDSFNQPSDLASQEIIIKALIDNAGENTNALAA